MHITKRMTRILLICIDMLRCLSLTIKPLVLKCISMLTKNSFIVKLITVMDSDVLTKQK